MKKIFIMAVAALCMGLTVTSCGDDEPEKEYIYIGGGNNGGGTGDNGGGNGDNGNGDNGGGNNGGGTGDNSRKILASITSEYESIVWRYSGNTLVSLSYGDNSYNLNGDRYIWVDEKYGETEIYSNILRNTDGGFVTSFTYTYTDDEETYVANTNLIYNNRRVSKIDVVYQGEEDGEVYQGTMTYNFAWSNGMLTQVDYKDVYVEDGEQETDESKITIKYGDKKNPFKQYSYYLASCFDDADEFGMALTGWLGDGPDYLPSSYTEIEGTYSDTDDVNYTLNNDGSIASEWKVYGGSYTGTVYNFAYLGDNNGAPAKVLPQNTMKSLVKKAHHHKHAKK